MKYTLFLAVFTLLFASCSKNQLENWYTSNPAQEHSFDSVTVITPNAFTPNGDGTNDLFRPIITEYWEEDSWGKPILTIGVESALLKITGAGGKTLYNASSTDWENLFWDGSRNFESTYYGNFTYKLVLETSRGTTKTITGLACSINKDKECVEGIEACMFEEGLVEGGGTSGYIAGTDNSCN